MNQKISFKKTDQTENIGTSLLSSYVYSTNNKHNFLLYSSKKKTITLLIPLLFSQLKKQETTIIISTKLKNKCKHKVFPSK
ncbi:unnamed protein product [Meloidogyne enterolobii]|uniref:Uncharacterized protein n=1 Tax=Meloidogyne enterolobii TaxID=390850 RepID=A0ACB0Z2M4_MELEN